MPGKYYNKTVVITGATEPVGHAIAVKFAEQGANIFLIGLDHDELLRRQDFFTKNYESRVGVISIDIGSIKQVKSGVRTIVRMVNRIDGIINCADYIAPGCFEKCPAEEFDKVAITKFLGPVHLIRALVPHMNEGGFISFLSAMTGYYPLVGYSSSAGPEAAIIGFAEVLGQELAPRGISVHILIPPLHRANLFSEKNLTDETISVVNHHSAAEAEDISVFFMKELQRGKFFMFFDFKSKLYHRLKGWFPGFFMHRVRKKVVHARKIREEQHENPP